MIRRTGSELALAGPWACIGGKIVRTTSKRLAKRRRCKSMEILLGLRTNRWSHSCTSGGSLVLGFSYQQLPVGVVLGSIVDVECSQQTDQRLQTRRRRTWRLVAVIQEVRRQR